MKRKKNYKNRKRRNKIISKIFLGIFLIFVLCIIITLANKIFSSKYENFSETDKEMFEQIVKVFDTFETSATEVWTENYRLDKQPVLICVQNEHIPFLSNSVYAFNIDLSGKFYAEKIDVPQDYFDGFVYRLSGVYIKGIPLFIHDGYQDLTINGQNAVAVKINKESFNNLYAVSSVDKSLISGGYDVFVVKNSRMPIYNEIEHYDYSRENMGLKGMECRLTDEILRCRDDAEKLDDLLCKFVTIRDARYRLNNEMAFEEPLCEMSLGCGEYSAYKLGSLIGAPYSYFDKNTGSEFEESFCEAVTSEEYEVFFTVTSPRKTGAAMGFILDKLSLGDGWRSAIENGTSDNIVTPYSILHEYCKQHCEQYGKINLDDLKEDYGYDIFSSLRSF